MVMNNITMITITIITKANGVNVNEISIAGYSAVCVVNSNSRFFFHHDILIENKKKK